MNYRHSFHAGNFADVLKHAVLMRVLAYLMQKEAPIRVIDTHAGAGFYDLKGDDALRTGEWVDGIARLRKQTFRQDVENILAPYRNALAALCISDRTYPGSPALIQHILRAQDRASFNELHRETCWMLRDNLGRDGRIVINPLDAYIAWKAQIPPPEKRGLVLVDPPFEEPGEFDRMAEGLAIMGRKWPIGTAILWYPLKDRRAITGFERQCRESAFFKLLVVEIHVDDPTSTGPLTGCGLLIANPPWTLADELALLLPALCKALARSSEARWRLDWLKQE